MVRSSLFTLGKFELWIGDRLAPAPPTRKARALIALLVSHASHDFARERLMEIFWSEFEPERAREGLRTALSSIRSALRQARQDPDEVLFADKYIVRWIASTQFDAARFEELARGASVSEKRRALETYGGDFMEGSYEEWVVGERDRIAALYESVLAGLVQQEQDADAARALLSRNPFHEEAYAALVDAQLRASRPAAATELIAQYRAAMREIDAEPSPAFEQRFAHVQAVPVPERSGRSARIPDAQAASGESNVPEHLSSFVGRDEDLAQVENLVRASRLVTLVGPGGIGKTRLAIQAAVGLRGEFNDGIWFVDLGAVSDPHYAVSAIASVLRVWDVSLDRGLQETLIANMHCRRIILILDNCEHLLGTVLPIVTALLHRCGQMHILCTSREPLNADGEEVLRLAPLSVRDAVALFAERAHAADKRFTLDERNAAAVAAICEQLDGIPLAIELAAPRAGVLGLKHLQQQLDEHFRILASGNPLAQARHKTVAALIDWSYDRLSEPEQQMLRTTSVFAAGFSLEAARALRGDGETVTDTLDTLLSLVSKSLVMVDPHMQPARYSLLHTTQQYAYDKLAQAGEVLTVRDRHARYFLQLMEAADRSYGAENACAWLEQYRTELENVRSAIEYCFAAGNAGAGAAIVAAARELWQELGLYAEGFQRAQHALAVLGEDSRPDVRAGLWLVVAQLGNVLYRTPYALDAAHNAVAVYESLHDDAHLDYALQTLGFSLIRSGDHAGAEAMLLRAQTLAERQGNRRVIARVLLRRGHNAHASGSCVTALPLYERCLELARTIEDELYVGYALGHLANVYFTLRDIPRSVSYGRAAREIFRRRNDGAKESNALANLAECHFVLGELGQAKQTAHAAIAKALESESMVNAVYAVQHLAAIAAAEGHTQPSARLLGYVEAALARLGSNREYGNTYTRDRALEALAQQISPAELQRLESDGAALSDAEAFALAAHLEASGRDALERI